MKKFKSSIVSFNGDLYFSELSRIDFMTEIEKYDRGYVTVISIDNDDAEYKVSLNIHRIEAVNEMAE